jgi:hypothetical protein
VKNQVGNKAWACFRPVDRKNPKRKLGRKSGRQRNKQAGKALELITKGRILAEKSQISSLRSRPMRWSSQAETVMEILDEQ